MTNIYDHIAVRLDPSLSEQAGFEAALPALAPLFDAAPLIDSERRHTVLTVTQDGGSRTSVGFWAAALHTGLGLASPSDFPWCLANASCATLARRFALTGPNYTWLADDLTQSAAYLGAAEVMAADIGAGRPVWVMANRFAGARPMVVLWRWHRAGTIDQMAQEWAQAAGGRDV